MKFTVQQGSLRVTKRVSKFCFGANYNWRLWENELGVSALPRGVPNGSGGSRLPPLPGTSPSLPSFVDRSRVPGTTTTVIYPSLRRWKNIVQAQMASHVIFGDFVTAIFKLSGNVIFARVFDRVLR